MIDVLRAGVLTSIQDLGRHGHRHMGVAQSGALDPLALRIANRLVGNPDSAAAIEFTLGPVNLRFARDTRFALTGADFGATLDEAPVHAWWSMTARAGQVLSLRSPRRGLRAYLAVSGGLDVASVLGSRSTDLKSGFGGLNGRALKDGDRVPIAGIAALASRGTAAAAAAATTGTAAAAASNVALDRAAAGVVRAGSAGSASVTELLTEPGMAQVQPRQALATSGIAPVRVHLADAPAFALDAPAFGVKPPGWCAFANIAAGDKFHKKRANEPRPEAIRIVPGPEYHSFSAAALELFWSSEWTVTPNSNRIGYRLDGPALTRSGADSGGNLLSHAVLPGTVQVPPNGRPIILMGDAGTAGGYPKIGAVISADMWRLAQVRLNGTVCFVECSVAEARDALLENHTYLNQINIAIDLQNRRSALGRWGS